MGQLKYGNGIIPFIVRFVANDELTFILFVLRLTILNNIY